MKYFTLKELTNSDTANRLGIDNTPSKEIENNLEDLVNSLLDPIRELYGKPIYVNSGYRCKELNKAVGGVPNSDHLKGKAADIDTKNLEENKRLYRLIKTHFTYKQLIWENKGEWIHLSIL